MYMKLKIYELDIFIYSSVDIDSVDILIVSCK